MTVQFTRLTTGAGGRLSQKLFTGGVDALLSIATQKDSGPGSLCFCRFFFNDPIILDDCAATEIANGPYQPGNVIPPDQLCGGKIDFAGSYGEYYWEIYFFIPFLIVDMVIATVLVSMGMLMVPPALISLPFKLMLFVLLDGWHLVVGMLLESFQPFT